MSESQRRLPSWLREVIHFARLALIAIPFAFFFGTIFGGGGWAAYWRAYQMAIVFTLVIGILIRVNELWIAPRIVGNQESLGGATLVLHIASFMGAAILGAMISATIVHFTVLPGMLGSFRGVTILVLFTLLFGALFVGIAYAFHFHGAFVNRIRGEERFKARVEHETRTAAQIQQALMPRGGALAHPFEAAGASLPSRIIGGDFLDYFELSGGRLAFVLGDVSGKGPPAAILAAALQGMFFSVAEFDETPVGAIRRVNRALVRRAVESRFATVFHGLLSSEGRLVACNAGHNPPLLLRRDGGLDWITTGGSLVGVFDQAEYEEETFSLGLGDALVLFSDGVTEADNGQGEMFGEERLMAALEGAAGLSASDLVARVLARVQAFSGEAAQTDDITVLAVRYLGTAG